MSSFCLFYLFIMILAFKEVCFYNFFLSLFNVLLRLTFLWTIGTSMTILIAVITLTTKFLCIMILFHPCSSSSSSASSSTTTFNSSGTMFSSRLP
ncbi:hypothetical protein BKA69DRAFT_486156 [Paraphysoderma sedebokerense]|nr:hypothetical protein BKA69DRAFT_486156 [Paraphysoderma sedebokerense]